jgi:hypothetical protein
VDAFSYLSVLISIVLGLGVTQVLTVAVATAALFSLYVAALFAQLR